VFTFTVSLSPARADTVNVSFWTDSGPAVTSPGTLGGRATSGIDYTATSGTLTFNPFETTKLITVNVIGDKVIEPNETFVVNLDVPLGAVIARSPGIGQIPDDDPFSIGTAELTPEPATVAVHERLTYLVTWTVPPPRNWHDLQSVQLRISEEAGTVLWVSFDEAAGTFSLLNTAGQPVGPAF